MLPGLVFQYEGVDGLKTGTTNFAGHCITGTAERNGTRLISVVMKAVDEKDKNLKEPVSMKQLNYLTMAFHNSRNKKLFQQTISLKIKKQ